MKKIKLLLSTVAFIAFSAASYAQIRGGVVDANGFPEVDAQVTVKGTSTVVYTDQSGQFDIDAKIGDVLLINGKEFQVMSNDMGVLKVQEEVALAEVTVIGYGIRETMEQKTGSYTTISAEDITKVGAVSFEQALQGQVPGLTIGSISGQPGAFSPIFVRGITSLTTDSMPLVVINGIPVLTGDHAGAATTANALANIDPSTIESVTVLRDAMATSLYGSRGANGVILVTLKKGINNANKFSMNTEFGFGNVAFEKKDWLDAQGHANYFANTYANRTGTNFDQAYAIVTGPSWMNWDGKTNDNWRKSTRNNTIGSEKYIVNYQGGADNFRVFTSLSYTSQQGLARDAKYDRISSYLNTEWDANDRLKLGFDISMSKSTQLGPSAGSSFSNPVFAGNLISPTQKIYNEDGTLNLDILYLNPEFNPRAIQDANSRISKFYKVLANVNGSYKIAPYLTFESRFGVDFNHFNELTFWNPDFGDGNNAAEPLGNGYGYASARDFTTWNWANSFNFNKVFADLHAVTASASMEAFEYGEEIMTVHKRGYPSGARKPTLNNAANVSDGTSSAEDYSFLSYIGRISYTFNNRYSVAANYRRDGSSRFSSSNKWADFYGVGVSWNINRENFLLGTKINDLKIRVSYGEVGNANIGNYRSRTLFAPAAGSYLGEPGGYVNQIGDRKLQWEATTTSNFGIDFGIFKNRISGSVEYYVKKSKMLLFDSPTNPSSSGFNEILKNIGDTRSEGFETILTVIPIRSNNINWSITANYAYNQSEIKRLNTDISVQNGLKAFAEGHNPTEFYTLLWAGVDQTNGKPLWYTDETRSATTSVSGLAALSFTGKQALPIHTAGLSSSFNYKGFNFSTQFTYAGGHSVYDNWGFVYNGDGTYGYLNTRKEWAEGGWTPENAGSATLPQQIYGGNSNSGAGSTRYLYDADHIRWRSAEVGYRFNKAVLGGDKSPIEGLYIYVKGYNLGTWAFDNRLWFDPETASNRFTYGVSNLGIYDQSQANIRQFLLGVTLDF